MENESNDGLAISMMKTVRNRQVIPLTLKILFSVYLLVLVPTYLWKYGPLNFLWFSDITLFLSYIAVMAESSLFASMAALCGLLLELFWTVDFFGVMVFDYHLTGLSDYMFDPKWPIWLRLLSLFHIVMPFLLIWLVLKLGYSRRALWVQTIVAAGVMLTTWWLTNPIYNVNWVFTYLRSPLLAEHALVYLMIQFTFIFFVYLLTDLVLRRLNTNNLA